MTNANDNFGCNNGSENIYSCRPFPITYTDGVREMAESCKAYWFIDVIISYQANKKVNKHSFQVWVLERIVKDFFKVTATDGNNNIIACQDISFSNFQFDKATIWYVNDCLLFPKEY